MDQHCLVCRKQSNGMHFGAITCRACAAFFRRAMVLNLRYDCKNGDNSCNVDGRGRSVCRRCRLIKCAEIGMKPEKVQLGYDPTCSIRILCDDRDSDGSSSPQSLNEQPCSSRKLSSESSSNIRTNPDFIFKFVPRPPGKQNVSIDFTDVTERIESLFSSVNSNFEENNELNLLTSALENIRKDQKSKNDIKFIESAEIPEVVEWLKDRIYKTAEWFFSSERLMSLQKEHKLQLFRSSWSAIRTFERITMSAKVFEEDFLINKKVLLNDAAAWTCERMNYVNFSSITELTNEYFTNLFEPFLCRYIEEVGRPIYEMNLSIEETAFCMINLLDFELTPEITEICEKLKDEVADRMHDYYTNQTTIKMYSHRLIKIMKIVKSFKKIFVEKLKVKELFWLFDIFHADISDPYFFEIF